MFRPGLRELANGWSERVAATSCSWFGNGGDLHFSQAPASRFSITTAMP